MYNVHTFLLMLHLPLASDINKASKHNAKANALNDKVKVLGFKAKNCFLVQVQGHGI